MTPRRGLIWPLILIVIGLAFLLANYGLIGPVSVVALLSLWPLILSSSLNRGRAAMAARGARRGRPRHRSGHRARNGEPGHDGGHLPVLRRGLQRAGEQQRRCSASRRQHDDASAVGGRRTYQLSGGGTSLVHAESDHDDLRVARADISGDRADVRIEQGLASNGVRFGPTAASHVKVQVASDVATSLTVDAGAGEFTIDTSDIKVTDARISVGAASVRFVLPHPAGDVPITISAGASSIVVEVPAGVEARITSTGGLNSTHFENPRFSGSETSGYASAKDRVTVRITAGVTSIVVR